MTFSDWLQAQEQKKSPIGDLARDTRRAIKDRDRRFTIPHTFTPDQLWARIEGFACPEAMQALKDAERAWKRALRKAAAQP